MKNRRIPGFILLSSALSLVLSQPGFSLSGDGAQSVTLHGTLQKSEAAPAPFFAPSSETPPSLQPHKTKFGPVKKVTSSAASLINFVFDVRGFDWSKDGANAILEEKLKPNSEPAREFLRHREEDEKQLSIVAATLQLASVQGKDAQKTKDALDNLTRLVGAEETGRLEDRLKLAGTSTATDTTNGAADSTTTGNISAVDKASVDVLQKCDRIRGILEAAAETDPVVALMTKRLHKYNHRNKFLQVTAKVVYVSMGIASFAPTLAAPIAETTLLTFMTVTGGPEQDKLLKEVYLSKCLQSRANLINEKAHLAADCYDMAVLTKNERLLACSKDLIRSMTSEKAMAAFLGTTPATAVAASASLSKAPASAPSPAPSTTAVATELKL